MGVLDGVRILEFAAIGPVPYAGMLLADMGADVLRIERPDRVPRVHDVARRGRRRLTLDLKDPKQRASARQLAHGADVAIEGLRPGVMERLGLGPGELRAENPRLIYARMTGWGQTGPLAPRAGHDIDYIAIAGALAAIGPPDGAPVPPLNLVGDFAGGSLFLVIGILGALLERRGSGQGQVIDAAMCDGAVSLLSLFHTHLANGTWNGRRGTNVTDGGSPSYTTYRCADGEYIAVGAGEPQFYQLFRDLAGLDDPAFDDRANPAAWPALRAKAQAVFAQRTRAEWMAVFEETDACVAPVLALEEAFEHPHLIARESVVTLDGVRQSAPAPRFSRTPSTIRPERAVSAEDALAAWSSAPG